MVSDTKNLILISGKLSNGLVVEAGKNHGRRRSVSESS